MSIEINSIEGLDNYTISYSNASKNLKHYSHASLIYKGYEVKIKPKYYATLDEAVQGLKDRIVQAVKDFDIQLKQGKN